MGTSEDIEETVTYADQFEGAFRTAIAGDMPKAALRRILLYGVVAVSLVAMGFVPVSAAVGIFALLLLAATDRYLG